MAREPAQLVVGGAPVAFVEHRLRNANISRMDGTGDIEDMQMDLLRVVAPRDEYGIMRNVRFGPGGHTLYWGKRGCQDPLCLMSWVTVDLQEHCRCRLTFCPEKC